jgi:hypothetical protein
VEQAMLKLIYIGGVKGGQRVLIKFSFTIISTLELHFLKASIKLLHKQCRHTGKLPIHGEAVDKAALYRDRYQLMLQRLTRDKYFSTPAFVTELMEDESCKVSFQLACLLQ